MSTLCAYHTHDMKPQLGGHWWCPACKKAVDVNCDREINCCAICGHKPLQWVAKLVTHRKVRGVSVECAHQLFDKIRNAIG